MTHLALARAEMDARLASARERHLAKQVRCARRLARRAERRRALGWWSARQDRRRSAAAGLPALEATAATTPTPLALAERPHRPSGHSSLLGKVRGAVDLALAR